MILVGLSGPLPMPVFWECLVFLHYQELVVCLNLNSFSSSSSSGCEDCFGWKRARRSLCRKGRSSGLCLRNQSVQESRSTPEVAGGRSKHVVLTPRISFTTLPWEQMQDSAVAETKAALFKTLSFQVNNPCVAKIPAIGEEDLPLRRELAPTPLHGDATL